MNSPSPSRWDVRVVTFNVAMLPFDPESVASLLMDTAASSTHILTIGLQEVAHSEQYAGQSGGGGGGETWARGILAWTAANTALSLVARTYQATNLLLILADRHILAQIARISFTYARNTLGGLTGHKGSIGALVSLVNASQLVFTLSHFVHDVSALAARVTQYKTNRGCAFPKECNVCASFWFGDLNFRVECSAEEATASLARLDDLLKKDQLAKVRRAGTAFDDYDEASISFPPTYRLFPGTLDYDQRRTPSWCDRILYKGNVACVEYTSVPAVRCSDHVPVRGHYEVSVGGSLSGHLHGAVEWPTWYHARFEHIPTWYTTVPLVVRFRLRREYWQKQGSYVDWVGVFPSTLPDCTNALRWVFAMTSYTAHTTEEDALTVAEFPQLPPGRYLVGYYSSNFNCLIGLSETFEVVNPPETS